MKAFVLAIVLLGLSAQAFAANQPEEKTELLENEARFLYYNGSSTAAAITLLGALILLAVIAYLIYVGGVLSTQGSSGYNRNDYQNSQYEAYDQNYAQYRSAQDGYDFNSLNVIQWISMLQDLYEKFDYNDLDCQKRLICEVMREPEYYGTVAQKFKSGFQYAKYLEVLSLPDDMRELLDEYLDANSRAEQNKACEEFFQCPYSIKDSMKRNADGNSL
jgi:hypothetical protein